MENVCARDVDRYQHTYRNQASNSSSGKCRSKQERDIHIFFHWAQLNHLVHFVPASSVINFGWHTYTHMHTYLHAGYAKMSYGRPIFVFLKWIRNIFLISALWLRLGQRSWLPLNNSIAFLPSTLLKNKSGKDWHFMVSRATLHASEKKLL